MKTSWNETAEAEKYIVKEMTLEELEKFEAKINSTPLLRINLFYQKKIYALVHLFHRKKLKEEAEAVHERLFSDPAKIVFRQTIYQLFKN
ncbi:MAG TPA: hypothetical protein VNW06_02895 [Cytophagaceae bacterium]|jgi:hypothetical protein|nr:hypothetical protein [Cytophagaceae bacterium]